MRSLVCMCEWESVCQKWCKRGEGMKDESRYPYISAGNDWRTCSSFCNWLDRLSDLLSTFWFLIHLFTRSFIPPVAGTSWQTVMLVSGDWSGEANGQKQRLTRPTTQSHLSGDEQIVWNDQSILLIDQFFLPSPEHPSLQGTLKDGLRVLCGLPWTDLTRRGSCVEKRPEDTWMYRPRSMFVFANTPICSRDDMIACHRKI